MDKLQTALKQVSGIILGQEKLVLLSFATFLSEGHLLIEGPPGVGKTTLSLSLAKTLGLRFKRIQGTSDLLPADITGAEIFDRTTNEFKFVEGPVFTNILMVDEINRLSPKTQSGLLEAMEEKQVTVEGKVFRLPEPFFVIATQNTVESYGTFPLPLSQLDRFLARVEMKNVGRELELRIIKEGNIRKKIDDITPVFSEQEVMSHISKARHVKVENSLAEYILDLVSMIRETQKLWEGVSTRAVLHLLALSKSIAYVSGRDYVVPDDIKAAFLPVLMHRVGYGISIDERAHALKEILKKVVVPI